MPIANDDIARAVQGQTIPRRFLQTVDVYGDSMALRWMRDAGAVELTYREYADRAARVAGALSELGAGRGTRVVLMLGNRPEFHVADVATMLTGATPISIYSSSSAEQVRYLAHHSAATIAIVEHAEYLDRVLSVRDALPDLAHVVVIDEPEDGVPDGVLRWLDLVGASPVDLEAAAHIARTDDLATVIYTSGTTGDPKGVMLDHANVCWTEESLRIALGFPTDGFRLVSYLPMAHVAERMTSHYGGLTHGYQITVCPDLHEVLSVFQHARPNILFGVPRTYERIHSGLRAVLAGDPDNEATFDAALAVGREVAAMHASGAEPTGDLASVWERVDAETLGPVRELLGLGDVRCAVASAAPMPVEILEFFRSLGLPLAEMYGLSESSGPVSWEPHRVRLGTVGRAIPGLELRVGSDGEVLVRGGNVFRGYLDDRARTLEALDADGWLHTGDIGQIDADGYLRIVDRKKELIITASGKNISPANIESALRAQPLISQACVVGDGRPHLVAIIVLDAEVAPVWAAAHGAGVVAGASEHPGALVNDPAVAAEVAREIHDVNERFSHSEQIRRFLFLGEEWLADSDELTPTMKLKRRSILAKYAGEIDALYDDEAGIEPIAR